jgi:hypothetical protein
MSEIHCLFWSDVGHIYITKRANLPHYQEVFSKFVAGLDCYDDDMPVYLYLKGQDHLDHFLLVQNSFLAAKPYMDGINWYSIHRSTCNLPKKATTTSRIAEPRQDNFLDILGIVLRLVRVRRIPLMVSPSLV